MRVNVFYLAVCFYFATGEGCTIYAAAGSEESILNGIGAMPFIAEPILITQQP